MYSLFIALLAMNNGEDGRVCWNELLLHIMLLPYVRGIDFT